MGEEKNKITKPALSTGIKVSGTSVRQPGTVATHANLPHTNIPDVGGSHFDVAHSDSTWKKAGKTININGKLTRNDILKLAKMGATITNCKIHVADEKSLKSVASVLKTKKG